MLTTRSKDRLTDMKGPLGNAGINLTPVISNLMIPIVRPESNSSLNGLHREASSYCPDTKISVMVNTDESLNETTPLGLVQMITINTILNCNHRIESTY